MSHSDTLRYTLGMPPIERGKCGWPGGVMMDINEVTNGVTDGEQ